MPIAFSLLSFLLPILSPDIEALRTYFHSLTSSSSSIRSNLPLQLYDLSKELSNLGDVCGNSLDCGDWRIGLLEEKELGRAVDISMDGFFKPKLILNENGMGSFERYIARNVVGAFTNFERKDAQISNYIGFKTRSDRRLSNPNLELSKYSFILAAFEISTDTIVGIVEVSLEEPDGMLAPPVQSPFKRDPEIGDMPYLCNLSIDSKYRRKGLGKLLCRACENIVICFWKKDTIYLHVEASNLPAQRLYINMGYVPATIKIPVWQRHMMGVDNVLYFKKQLIDPNGTSQFSNCGVDSIYEVEFSNSLNTEFN